VLVLVFFINCSCGLSLVLCLHFCCLPFYLFFEDILENINLRMSDIQLYIVDNKNELPEKNLIFGSGFGLNSGCLKI